MEFDTRTSRELQEDRRLAAQKAGVKVSDLEPVGIMEADGIRIYLWNVTNPASEQFNSAICGKTWEV